MDANTREDSGSLEKPDIALPHWLCTRIFGGQPARTSIDLGSWQKTSRFAHADLRQACEKAGVLFNPKSDLKADTPYLQIVEEGIVQVGQFKTVTTMMEMGELTVTRPPIENIVASKLVRMEGQDVDDISYLLHHYRLSRDAVERIIERFPAYARERASENLPYLDFIAEPAKQSPKNPRKKGKRRP